MRSSEPLPMDSSSLSITKRLLMPYSLRVCRKPMQPFVTVSLLSTVRLTTPSSSPYAQLDTKTTMGRSPPRSPLAGAIMWMPNGSNSTMTDGLTSLLARTSTRNPTPLTSFSTPHTLTKSPNHSHAGSTTYLLAPPLLTMPYTRPCLTSTTGIWSPKSQ